MPAHLESNVYRAVVCPLALYGMENSAVSESGFWFLVSWPKAGSGSSSKPEENVTRAPVLVPSYPDGNDLYYLSLHH